MSDKFKSILINTVIVLLVVVGIGLLCIQPIQNYLVSSYKPNITRQTVEANAQQPKKASYNFNQVKDVTPLEVAQARWHANENRYVGQILAPSIGLHLPIGLGVGNTTLMLGAGTMRADMKMGTGNYALAGHHMKDNHVLFSPIYEKAQIGTKIYITDMDTIYTYQINVRKIIDPHQIQVVDNTKKPILTLITCNDSGSARLLTQGKLIDKTPLKQAPTEVINMLNQTTNNHNVLKGY